MSKKPETSDPEVPALVARLTPVAQIPSEQRPKPVPPVARSGAETKAAMDRVNNDKTIENRIMTERGARFEPVPSDRNAASQGVNLFDMTFSQYGEQRFGGNPYVRSRRRFDV
jgi:hypothetical protein